MIIAIIFLINVGNPPALLLMWLIYIVISIYASKFLYTLFSAITRLSQRKKRKKKFNTGILAGIISGFAAFIIFWWGALYTRNDIHVERVTFYSNKLPAGFDNYKIVQFSDVHLGSWGENIGFVSKIVSKINSLKPDLIVFTGDLVNYETSEMEPFLRTLSELKATDGIYSVLGNHDYGDYAKWQNPTDRDSNNALMAVWQRQIGWNLLNNAHTAKVRNNDTIILIGVENWGEFPFHQYCDIQKAYGSKSGDADLKDDKFKILLSHNPEHWNQEISKHTNIDLTLSGHTHAMQFMIRAGKWKWSPAKWRYPQWAGFYERNNEDSVPTHLYVNIGVGEIGVPARIGATPEITEITLKRVE